MRGWLLANAVIALAALAAPAAADSPPWLGIRFLGGPDDPLVVTEVYPGTGAARAGLLLADQIIAVDDDSLMGGGGFGAGGPMMMSPGEVLRFRVRSRALGDVITVRVVRDGQVLDLPIRLGAMPPSGELLELRLAGSPLPPMTIVDRHDGVTLLDGRATIMIVLDARCDGCADAASAMVAAVATADLDVPVRTVIVGAADQVQSYLSRIGVLGVVGRVERSNELGPDNPVLSGLNIEREGAILVVDHAGVVQFAASTADLDATSIGDPYRGPSAAEVRAGALAAAARVQQRGRRPHVAGLGR